MLMNLNHKMAAATVENLEKELFCAVCMQVLTRPKSLSSCAHTFCETCLQLMASSAGQENSLLKCPMCRKMSTMPGTGVSGLKSNPLICRIIDVLKSKLDSGQKGCDSCGDTESPLITYCRDCFQLICQSCTESHERMKLKYSNHRTVLLSDIRNGKVKISLSEDAEKTNEFRCSEHDWELRRYFCKTCKLRICRDCIALEHSTDEHDCTTLRQIFCDIQEKTRRLRDKCQQRKEDIIRSMNAVDVKERGTSKKFQEMRESVAVATIAARTHLKEAQEQLLSKVDKLEKAFKRKVQLSRDDVSGLADNIDVVMSKAVSIIATNEAPEFSSLPDDIMKEMEELLAEEIKVGAMEDLLALRGTSIQSHHLSLTMSSYPDVVLSGVWHVTSIVNLHRKSRPVQVFCNNTHVILATKKNVYKRSLDIDGTAWNEKLLSIQSNIHFMEATVSWKDQLMYMSFQDDNEFGIRMVRLSEINGSNGNYSSFTQMQSVTPPYWSDETAMMTVDCTGRVIIIENQIGHAPSGLSASPEIPKSSPDKIQGTPKSTCSAFPAQQASTLPASMSLVSVSGSSSSVVRRKVRAATDNGSPSTSATKQMTDSGENFGVISFRSAKVHRHRPNTSGVSSARSGMSGVGLPKCDSLYVPFGVVSVAAAKTGQLAFLREDKRAVIITDEFGRIQHEIKEPGKMYLSISCTESNSLFVLSAFWGSHTVTLTKHSLEDGGLLEYVIDKLDESDGVLRDKWPIIGNYGNDRVIVNVGKEIRIYSREDWTVLDEYVSEDSDDDL